MSTAVVSIPGLLSRFADGSRSVIVTADTVGDALESLLETYPALKVHVLTDDGALRDHLQLYHDGMRVDLETAQSRPIEDDDKIRVFQAVSGG